MTRTTLLGPTLGLVLLPLAACQSGSADVATVPETTETETVLADKPVVGLDIIEVTANQAVEVVMWDQDGTGSGGLQAPIIRNRAMLLRVLVKPIADFEPRRVRGILEVENGDDVQTFESKIRVEERSKKGDLESTFNFDLAPELVQADTKLKVYLYEANASEERSGEEMKTTWKSGQLQAEQSDTLNVLLVPIRYNFDGSGRVPDTSAGTVEIYKRWLLATYPVENVEITVSEVVDWNDQIQPWSQNQWGNLLYALSDARGAANVDPNTYYYGIFNAAPDYISFCSSGCILGLSNLAWTASDPWYRTSIGIGFTGFGDVAATTFVHEVGHAHGRNHADCGGASGIDPSYPYGPNAIIGSWGYNTATGELFDPEQTHDMMGYCEPMWISDYTYYNLFIRVRAVGQIFRSDRIDWQTIRVFADGTAELDKVREHVPELDGEIVTVDLIGGAGQVLETIEGRYSALSHGDGVGGMVAVPVFDTEPVMDVVVHGLQ